MAKRSGHLESVPEGQVDSQFANCGAAPRVLRGSHGGIALDWHNVSAMDSATGAGFATAEYEIGCAV